MKKLVAICAAIMMTVSVFAQAPNKMSYQAVIRNSSNALLTNTSIGMRISIIQTSTSGTAVYVETQNPTTNANGLASIEIGDGLVVNGNFATINWANGPYFIKTETDLIGGSNYTITNTSQLLSVPYALFSGNGIIGYSAIGDTLYLGNGTNIIVPGISAANNSGGGQTGITQHTCGADSVHNPNLTYDSVTDYDGNVYKTIAIGTQEWMAENLKAKHYQNGEVITLVTNTSSWADLITGASSWYNNDSVNYSCPYGKLYNWYAVTDPRNICPLGWHVPSDAEWSTLINYIDPNANGGMNSNTSGGKMKSTSTQYWILNQDATNESGFSGLPGGHLSFGSFNTISYYGEWWSSSESDSNYAPFRLLNFQSGGVNWSSGIKSDGYSVRCLKD